jgi:hypothetical protein
MQCRSAKDASPSAVFLEAPRTPHGTLGTTLTMADLFGDEPVPEPENTPRPSARKSGSGIEIGRAHV